MKRPTASQKTLEQSKSGLWTLKWWDVKKHQYITAAFSSEAVARNAYDALDTIEAERYRKDNRA